MILSVLHLPSMCFVLIALFLGVCARGSIHNMVKVARDSSLVIGSQGTLIGLVLMLQDLQDSSGVGMALSTSLLTLLYGFVFYVFLNAVYEFLGPEDKLEASGGVNIFTILGMIGLVGAIATSLVMSTKISNFINVEALLLFVGAMGLSYMSSRGEHQNLMVSIAKYSLWAGVGGVLLSYIVWLGNMDDPTSVGPSFAFGIISLLYGGFLYTSAQFVHASIFKKSFSFGAAVNVGYSAAVLAYISFGYVLPTLFFKS